MPSPAPVNLNVRRRLLPGLLAACATPALRLFLPPLRRRAHPGAPIYVFSSYMVGDLYMALPALTGFAAQLGPAVDFRVLCRPDCVEIVTRAGLQAVPFDNAFFTRRTPNGLLRTLRAAWALRALPAGTALDLDADPRSALWLRIAGCTQVVSYRRPFSGLFDATFALPGNPVHQADRDRAVVEEFLRIYRGEFQTPQSVAREPAPGPRLSPELNRPGAGTDTSAPNLLRHDSPWILSVWTRKAAKNWPLDRWDGLMEELIEEGVPIAVLHAPDGDSAYQLFRARWEDRVPFVAGSLEAIDEGVQKCAGVIATDNFLGHMAGYHGKPVVWINVVSPAEQVEPRGPHTVRVGEGSPQRPETPTVEAVVQAFKALRVPASQ